MIYDDAAHTERRLPYLDVARSIAEVLLLRAQGETDSPERLVVPLPRGGTLLVMAAIGAGIGATKTVTVHPENRSHDLPTIQGELVAFDAATGARLGALDGAAVTRRRTAALSLLAAQTLTGTAREALIIGAGAQAAAHLEALREGLGVRHFYITARTLESAERLAAAANGDGVAAEAVPNAEAVAQKVSLIVTATTSEAPVVPAGVTDHTTILAVGAFRPDMAELPARLIARSNVVVDTLEGAQAEAGDLIQAQAAGVWSWDTAVELQDVLAGKSAGGHAGPTIFKSVGHSLFDLAAARVAFAEERRGHPTAPERRRSGPA